MAKDDDLLPEDQPAENLLPEEQPQAAAPAPEPEAPARPETAAPISPVAAELSTKPGNNVWTMLMLISILAMIAGIWIQAQELNEIFKINIIPGSKSEESVTLPPDQPTEPGTGGGGATTDAAVPPPATTDKAGEKAGGETPAPPKDK